MVPSANVGLIIVVPRASMRRTGVRSKVTNVTTTAALMLRTDVYAQATRGAHALRSGVATRAF
jgi:hypothetical protein